MSTKQLRAVGYVRRSTDHQDRSLGDQRTAIQAYAADHHWKLDTIYEDDAISGTSTHGRIAFHRMIAHAGRKPRPFDCVLVYDIKRFGRMDNDETGYYRHLLRLSGVRICYTSEDFVDGFIDDLVRPVKQWQARQESRDLAKIVIRGYVSKFGSHGGGWWLAGAPPFGYDRRFEDAKGRFLCFVRSMPDRTKQIRDLQGITTRVLGPDERLMVSDRDRCRLVPSEPDRVALVQRVFYECTENGLGATAIAHLFNREGIPTPRAKNWSARVFTGQWAQATIRLILMNPAYVGDIVWNRRTCGTFYRIQQGRATDRPLSESQVRQKNPKEDWMIIRDAHEPLVNRHVFEQAKYIVSVRHQVCRRSSPDYMRDESDYRARYLLTGLLECAYCKRGLQGTILKRRYFRRRTRHFRARMYSCQITCPKGTHDGCRGRYVRQRLLEHAVCERLIDWYGQFLQRDGWSGKVLIERAAEDEYRRMVESTAPDGRWAGVGAQAALLAANSVQFLKDLRTHLYDPDIARRRVAIRRCVDHVEVDLKRRLIAVFARRLPMNGAVSGGLARLVAHLPMPRGKLTLGPRKRTTPKSPVYDLEWHCRKMPEHIRRLVLRLMDLIGQAGPHVTQSFAQCYIAFSLHHHFASLKVRQSRVLLYLKLNPADIGHPPPYFRDVTGIATQTTGNVELSVDPSTDLNSIRSLVHRAYRVMQHKWG